jgi:hypothetical protein
MRKKSLEQSEQKYKRETLKTYLEGEQQLSWILGIFRSDKQAMRHMLAALYLSGHNTSKPERLRELSAWLDS